MRRAVAGLVAGVIAGAGMRLTWRPFIPAKCATSDTVECALTTVWSLPTFMIGWTLVAGLALHWTLRKRPEVADVIKVGGALWAALAISAWNTGVLARVEIVLPVVAFAVAAFFLGPSGETGRS